MSHSTCDDSPSDTTGIHVTSLNHTLPESIIVLDNSRIAHICFFRRQNLLPRARNYVFISCFYVACICRRHFQICFDLKHFLKHVVCINISFTNPQIITSAFMGKGLFQHFAYTFSGLITTLLNFTFLIDQI